MLFLKLLLTSEIFSNILFRLLSLYKKYPHATPRRPSPFPGAIKASAQSTARHPEDSGPIRVEMRGFAPSAVCQYGIFTSLLLFSFLYFTAAVSFDLTELRNKVAKIKVNPRGNLWATGKNNEQICR